VTYEESLAWLDSTRVFGIKLGLANTRLLLEGLENPQDSLAFFHVAGTNGKGSVCAMLDALLRSAGLRTGLYTSPHLVDFRERIRVDGEKISREAVADGLTKIRAISADWDRQPTFFEITTVLAIAYFAAQGCRAVVLETGMGGRLDATNAVTPAVSVLTPIALDHRQWLGNTIAEIAQEKAGIIKPGVPVVSAPQDASAAEVLEGQAARLGSPLEFVTEPLENVPVRLRGSHQKLNAALAVTAVARAGIALDDVTVRAALADVRWPGRFQIVDHRVVLDGAHNPHAAESLVVNWREHFGQERPVVILGALEDKEYPVIIEKLEGLASEFYFVPVKSFRSASPESLQVACQIPNTVFASAQEALAASRGLTLVTGSLFLVGEVMSLLGIEP
jgi:dihydrofolate synthase/folylpolyglutamate synthase